VIIYPYKDLEVWYILLKKTSFFIIISLILVLSLLYSRGDEEQEIKEPETISNWAYDYVGKLPPQNDGNLVKVAILDSGITKNHEELEGINFEEFNALDPNLQIADDLNHGTPIAGIIAAKGKKFKGLTDHVKIYDVKVLDSKGQGKLEKVIAAINWCIEKKVQIINISFGFDSGSLELEKAVKKALANDIIIVASAGNQLGLKTDFPARYNGVLSVNSLNKDTQVSNISSQGKVDFSAPGEEILSINSKGNYELYTGSSFATAFVTGSIASILSQNKNLDIKDELLTTLLHHTVDLGEDGYDKTYGHGVIRLDRRTSNEKLVN
jgi:subtilisin family serine protease